MSVVDGPDPAAPIDESAGGGPGKPVRHPDSPGDRTPSASDTGDGLASSRTGDSGPDDQVSGMPGAGSRRSTDAPSTAGGHSTTGSCSTQGQSTAGGHSTGVHSTAGSRSTTEGPIPTGGQSTPASRATTGNAGGPGHAGGPDHAGGPHHPDGQARTVRRNPVPSLLESLNRDYLDPGYAAAAKRKAAAGSTATRPRSIALLVAACVVLGLLFGISVVNTEANEPRAEKTRSALLEDIDHAEQQQSALASSAADLAGQLRATQSNLGAAGPLQTVAALENAGQVTPVAGPGLRIVINEAPADSANATSGGVILDRDVQLLVNDLWAAGAEAISIGGVRLQPRSAIRQAGGSILVDNRPVFWPITIEAVGDSSGMQVNLVGSPGFGRFSSFAQLYDIEFEVTAQTDMTLPAGSAADLRYARPPVTATPTPPAPSASTPTAGPAPSAPGSNSDQPDLSTQISEPTG